MEPYLEERFCLYTPRRRWYAAAVLRNRARQLRLSASMMLRGCICKLEPALEAIAGHLTPPARINLALTYESWQRQFYVTACVLARRRSEPIRKRFPRRLGWRPIRRRQWN
jgi:hypothetical protein